MSEQTPPIAAPTGAEIGDRVVATDGEAGTVVETIGAAGGEPAAFVVETVDGDRVEVPVSLIAERRDGVVSLPLARSSLVGDITAPVDAGGERIHRLSLHEEVLDASTRPVRRGTVRVVRRIETVPVQETIETWRDDVVVERVSVNREVETAPEPRMEGETIVVPVVEEVVVAQTRLVLREEVRISRRRVAEPVVVEGVVRREAIDVVQPDDQGKPAVDLAPGVTPEQDTLGA